MNARRFPDASCRVLAAFAVLMALVAAGSALAVFDLSWNTVDGGGSMTDSGQNLAVYGTAGQPDAGLMTGGNFTIVGGFWPAASAPPPIACGCGDLDDSGLVNLADFSLLSACYGLDAPSLDCPAALFLCADLDGSGAIDLVDFSLFSGAFGLPPQGSPPDCN